MWKARVRKVYKDLEELKAYNWAYNVVKRLGYKSAEKLWADNPIIMGSVYPADFSVFKPKAKRACASKNTKQKKVRSEINTRNR